MAIGCLISQLAMAQPPMATLTGQVVAAQTLEPLPGASLALLPGNPHLTATTDSSGHFRISAIPVGHYALRVTAVGHDTLEVPELWLRAGKQHVQRIELDLSSGHLGSVTISALARERPSLLGVQPFTVEQSLRWAATFFDPARLVSAIPGVATTNDEANHLSIRGNSPNANTWLLEGVEIVNPNHTGNAGTATDLPTLSGGGVTLLSAQMLGPSQLLTGVLPMERDNALGGILDMRLRKGNQEKQEWTVQAGLLGLDLATEGPIAQGGRSSYLANYRYSTVGLLSSLGVDFGDEHITYQDLSFHVALPAGKRGEWHLFGLGGNSSNVFKAVHDTSQWEVDKDSRNIDYSSRMGAVGARIRVPVGRRGSFSAALGASAIDQVRDEQQLADDYRTIGQERAALNERKLSGAVQWDGAVGARFRYALGATALERQLYTPLDPDTSAWTFRPWAHGRWTLTEHLEIGAGLGLPYFTGTRELLAEPRAQLAWRMRQGRALALAAGTRSQWPQWQSFATRGDGFAQQAIGPSRSLDVVLGYDHPVADRLVLHAEVYHQHITALPVAAWWAAVNNLAIVNLWNEQFAFPLIANGTATNQGVEASIDHRFATGFFYCANLSLFNSAYSMHGHTEGTRWNNNYIGNLLGGKEFRKQKEDRVRTWGISGRVNTMGGGWDPPLPAYTGINGEVVFAGQSEWEQLPAYFRLDLRVYLKKDRKGHTGLWALDLQNVTNQQNVAFHYWDARQGKVVAKNQLGLIPNLSYRIEF